MIVFSHEESAEPWDIILKILRILRVLESKLHHYFDIHIPRCQVVVDAIISVVNEFHPSVGNCVGNVQKVENIHANKHVFHIPQWIAFAETACLADELFAEANVDAAIGGITPLRVVKVGIVAVVGQAHAKGQGHVDAPSREIRDVVLEKQREINQLI